jgi:hypothetical protein
MKKVWKILAITTAATAVAAAATYVVRTRWRSHTSDTTFNNPGTTTQPGSIH